MKVRVKVRRIGGEGKRELGRLSEGKGKLGFGIGDQGYGKGENGVMVMMEVMEAKEKKGGVAGSLYYNTEEQTGR